MPFVFKRSRPGHDLKDTPRRLIWFQDDSESALRLNSILFAMAILIVVLMRNRIKRASVAQTMLLKVKALKARAAGGKIRTF